MIGVFDSGIGGLTVVKQFFKYLPERRIVYLGDTARLPYGTKSPELIKKWSKEISQWLVKKGAKTIVIACHTASSLAGDFLKEEFSNLPVFEIITPGIKKAAQATENKKIGIIASPATIKSGVHKEKLLRINPGLKVYSQACPLFVPLVEEGWINRPQTEAIAREYLLPLKRKGIDTLVLACTHYPLLRKTISKVIGKSVKIIDPAEDLAKEFKRFLENSKLEKRFKKNQEHQFFFSDQPYNSGIISKLILNREIFPRIINF